MAEQVQLKLVKRTEEGFFGKAISNIGKAVYSSGSSLYTLLISTKRGTLLKHYASYKTAMEIADENKRNSVISKYEKSFESYLNTLEKYSDNKLVYDDKGNPSVMVKIPKMTYSDLGIGDFDMVHPAFIVNGKEIEEIALIFHNTRSGNTKVDIFLPLTFLIED